LRPLHIDIRKHHQAHWPPSLCVLRASTCVLFARSLTCRPFHLWGRRAPTTGLVSYVNALPAILQEFPCVCHACVADGKGLAHAQALASRRHPARAPGRTLPTSVPAAARVPRHRHGPHNAARSCAPVVDPTSGQRGPSSRPVLDVTRSCESPRVWRGVGRRPRVPTGEIPSEGPEHRPLRRASLAPRRRASCAGRHAYTGGG